MLNPFTWIFLFLHPLSAEKLREYLIAIDSMPTIVPSLILAMTLAIYLWLIFFAVTQFQFMAEMPGMKRPVFFGLGVASVVPLIHTVTWRVHEALNSVDAGEPAMISFLPDLSLYGLRTAMLPLDLSGLTTLFATEGTVQRVIDSLIYLTPEGVGLVTYPVILLLLAWGRSAPWARPFFAGAALSYSLVPATIVIVAGYGL